MKKLLLGTFCAAALSLCQSASATVINVLGSGDFPAQDISSVTGNPGLGDANVLAWLQAEIEKYGFPTATTDQSDYTGGPVAAGDYLVLHYGSGPGGTSAGGLVALYFDADQDSYTVPPDGSGPNGFGGISFARLYDHTATVPEGGMTLFMLGAAGVGLGLIGRFGKKTQPTLN